MDKKRNMILHYTSFWFLHIAGLPALIVSISLSIAAGKEGIESFVSDK